MRPFVALASTVALVLVSSVALADVPPPNTGDCTSKQAGEACEQDRGGGSGVCTKSTCTRLDYSQRNDAGAPTPVMYECLVCEAASATDGGSTADGGTDAAKDSSGCASTGGAARWGAAGLLVGLALLLRARPRR